jgi:hypothetical protein
VQLATARLSQYRSGSHRVLTLQLDDLQYERFLSVLAHPGHKHLQDTIQKIRSLTTTMVGPATIYLNVHSLDVYIQAVEGEPEATLARLIRQLIPLPIGRYGFQYYPAINQLWLPVHTLPISDAVPVADVSILKRCTQYV